MHDLLTEEESAARLLDLPNWTRDGGTIRRLFVFADFIHAMAFVSSVALLAEKANHHPDIDIRWNKVTLSLSTHSAGGLTFKDIELADQIDRL